MIEVMLVMFVFAVGAALFLAVNARITAHMLADEFAPAPTTRAVGARTPWQAYRSETEALAPVTWRTDGELLAPEGPVLRIGSRSEPEPPPNETWTPARTPTVEADFIVPTAQALMTAAAAALATGLLAWALGWSWRVPVAVGGLAVAAAWLWRLGKVDSLLWTVEGLSGVDLNRDGNIGRPLTVAVANPAQARATVARETREQEREARKQALLEFVDRCFLVGTSESAQGIAAGDRADYLTCRDTLLALGIARWRNPNRPKAGWEMVVSRHRARQLIEKHTF